MNRAEIYATLGVPEVWRFNGQTLRIERLREDGSGYDPADASLFLPIPPGGAPAGCFWTSPATTTPGSAGSAPGSATA